MYYVLFISNAVFTTDTHHLVLDHNKLLSKEATNPSNSKLSDRLHNGAIVKSYFLSKCYSFFILDSLFLLSASSIFNTPPSLEHLYKHKAMSEFVSNSAAMYIVNASNTPRFKFDLTRVHSW